jgi:preprotein translocase subunit SecD
MENEVLSIIDSTLTNIAVSVAVTYLQRGALIKGFASDFIRGNIWSYRFCVIFNFLLFDALKRRRFIIPFTC